MFSWCMLLGMTVTVNGQNIKSVKIGQQIWMAENMKVAVPGSWCYNDDPALGAKFGRLYTWEAAKIVCPKGWRLPNEKDWDQLIVFLGGEDVAGNKIKTGGIAAGFNAMLGGITSVGNYRLLNLYGAFWSATSYDSDHAWYYYITNNGPGVTKTYFNRSYGLSVRCIKAD